MLPQEASLAISKSNNLVAHILDDQCVLPKRRRPTPNSLSDTEDLPQDKPRELVLENFVLLKQKIDHLFPIMSLEAAVKRGQKRRFLNLPKTVVTRQSSKTASAHAPMLQSDN